MRSKYVSQQDYSTEFLLYRTRYLPREIISGPLKNVVMSIEEAYRNRRIQKRKAVLYGKYLKMRYNIDYEVLDDHHMIFLPHSPDLLSHYFIQEPTVVGLIGGRGSGKTITAWKLALDALDKIENATLYVYNDVDGIGSIIAKRDPRVVVKEEAAVPPMDGLPKIIIYNELTERQMSKKWQSSENIDLNLQALRTRHRLSWIIQNIITYSGLEKILKQTTTVKVFKWMDPVLLEHTKDALPKGWKKLVEICAFFGENEGLAVIPVKKKGNVYYIHETNPPPWLLQAHKKASKTRHLLMVKSEREREYMNIISEILAKDPKAKSPDVQVIMEQDYHISLSVRRVRELISKWKAITRLDEHG